MTETVSFDVDRVKHETDKAILVEIEGQDVWVPKSLIDDESEVWSKKNESGTLISSALVGRARGTRVREASGAKPGRRDMIGEIICENCAHAIDEDPAVAVCVGCYELLARGAREARRMVETDRDRLAAMAMQGLAANPGYANGAVDETLARWAYALADAMLAERSRDRCAAPAAKERP